jgi:Fe-S cluster assembly protein SufB
VTKPSSQSLDEIDPELLETYKKLGIPLDEQERLAGVAVDAVFDSVSVATTFKGKQSLLYTFDQSGYQFLVRLLT